MAAGSMEEYLQGLKPEGRQHVREFMDFMKQEFPQLTPRISFAMPMWLSGTKMRDGYVAISPAERHFSIHFSEEAWVQELGRQLPSCRTGKRCINIQYGDSGSFAAVKESVRRFLSMRLKEK